MVAKSYKDFLFVGMQVLLLSVYVIPVRLATLHFNRIIAYVGLFFAFTGLFIVIVALIQLNKNLTPFPTPKDGSELITTGLYKFVRHPIYTGVILTVVGYGIYKESIWKTLVAVLLLILFYYKSKYEEEMLMKRYEEYKDYEKRTAKFLPFIFFQLLVLVSRQIVSFVFALVVPFFQIPNLFQIFR